MPFVTRAEWGARPPKSFGNVIGAHPKGVAIHYEGPKMGSRDHSKCDAMVRGIQNFHMDGRGWVDLAYSYAVCEHGYVYEGRGVKRGSAANGTTAANLDYYAVCGLVGEGDATPNDLLTGIRDAVDLCRRNGAGDALVGHRDLYATACPGTALYGWMRQGCPRPAISGGGGGQDAPIPAPPLVPTPNPQPQPTPAPVKPVVPSGRIVLAVDGVFGVQSRKRLQQWASVAQDGVLGRQSWTAVQRKVGVPADGVAGPQTWRAIQRLVGSPADGLPGRNTYLALQRYLNQH